LADSEVVRPARRVRGRRPVAATIWRTVCMLAAHHARRGPGPSRRAQVFRRADCRLQPPSGPRV